SFRSLRFVSFWSGQLMVPASLSPSFLIVRVDVRFCAPLSYSHFHVPTGSTLSAAPARPQIPRTNASERTAFIIASQTRATGTGRHAHLHPPMPAALARPRYVSSPSFPFRGGPSPLRRGLPKALQAGRVLDLEVAGQEDRLGQHLRRAWVAVGEGEEEPPAVL